MSGSVFMAPCDPEHFDRTVRSAVDPSDYPDHPEALSDMDAVRFLGAPEGTRNLDNFERMEAGDLVLFYADGSFVGTGVVGTTFEDEAGWASETFWDGAPITHLYTVEEFAEVSVPKAAVNHIFEYSAGYSPAGLMRVAEEKVSNSPEAIRRALELYTEDQD